MSAFLNQRLTNGGWDALSIALGGGRLTFYKMQAGSGTIANDDAIMGMTTLVSPVCDIPVNSYVIEGDGQITLFGNINSKDLTTGFTFRELGVFATIEAPIGGKGGTPSGPNIQVIPQAPSTQANPVVPPPAEGTALMYSYCNSYGTSDYIPGSGETTDVTNTVQVTIKIDEAENVVINILAGEQFSVVNIGPPSVGAGPWSYTEANVGYFKRLVAGPLTDITEDTNTITIGQKQLTSDLDLYVANGNPNISPHFSSIQNALNYLGQYIIPTTVKARINVSAGTYTSPNAIVIDHPNSQSITIQGPQNTGRVGTSLSIAGSANAWNLTINGISNTSEFVVNDWAIIHYIGGVTSANHGLACGFFKVLSKTASSVTVRVPNPKASFSITGATAIHITPISVILMRSVANTSTVYIGAYGIKAFQYMGVIPQVAPSATMAAMSINGSSYLRSVGVANFNLAVNSAADNLVYGFAVSSNCSCDYCAVTNCQCGFIAGGAAALNLRGAAASYNSFRAIWAQGGSCGFIYEPTFVAGNWYGLVGGSGAAFGIVATIPPGFVLVMKNDFYGLWLTGNASLSFTSTVCTLWLQDNSLSQGTHYDIVVNNYGLVNSSVCVIGTRIFNSPVGVINSSGGLIN